MRNRCLYISLPKRSPYFIGTAFLIMSGVSLSFCLAFSERSFRSLCSGSRALSGAWLFGGFSVRLRSIRSLTWLVPQLYRSRFLSGALNGNVGVVKSVLAELADDSNVAQAFSFLPLVFVIGQVIGFGLLIIYLFSFSWYPVRSVLL